MCYARTKQRTHVNWFEGYTSANSVEADTVASATCQVYFTGHIIHMSQLLVTVIILYKQAKQGLLALNSIQA